MNQRRQKKTDWSFYGILDHEWINNRDLKTLTEQLIAGGCTVLQYRNKISDSRTFYEEAVQIHSVSRTREVPLIINDRLDIALAVDAEGVHVGQNDLPESIVRSCIGAGKLLGVSVHDVQEAALIRHADYLGVGAMFNTRTKSDAKFRGLDLMRAVRSLTSWPLIGIGGITMENAQAVMEAGADGIAVISAILGEDNPGEAARKIRNRIKKNQ